MAQSKNQGLDAQALRTALEADFEQMTQEVAQAVGEAGQDDVIGHSEYQVRDAMGRLRSRCFEVALQMRIDAAEAAFSPSGDPAGARVPAVSQGSAKPGGADGQRLDPG